MKTELYPGHRVRVRPLAEITATLDQNGTFESLPFMPEMAQFCGSEFRVLRRLEKTCVEGYGVRLLPKTVLLEGLRCDGAAHDDCQRHCPLLWKESWLEPVKGGTPAEQSMPSAPASQLGCLKTRNGDGRYFCQSTQLDQATAPLCPITFRRCTAEFCSKNVGLRKALQFLWKPLVVRLKTKLLGLRSVQPVGYSIRTPVEALNLQPGELVEVKTPCEIGVTLDRMGRNRGLAFTSLMLPFCGRRYVVRARVERAILEATGQMHEFKHTVILDQVTCDGHTILGGCSRDVYHLWREIWLRRVSLISCLSYLAADL